MSATGNEVADWWWLLLYWRWAVPMNDRKPHRPLETAEPDSAMDAAIEGFRRIVDDWNAEPEPTIEWTST